MNDVRGLIAKLEKATGADRTLDCEIWLALHPKASAPEIMADFRIAERCVEYGKLQWDRVTTVATYTSSIDAALTLIVDGWDWLVEKASDRLPRAHAEVWNDWIPSSLVETDAATPALALCVAALKARTNG